MYYSKLITFIMHFVINLNCGYFHMLEYLRGIYLKFWVNFIYFFNWIHSNFFFSVYILIPFLNWVFFFLPLYMHFFFFYNFIFSKFSSFFPHIRLLTFEKRFQFLRFEKEKEKRKEREKRTSLSTITHTYNNNITINNIVSLSLILFYCTISINVVEFVDK